MWPRPKFLLVQVYLPLEGFISSRYQSWMMSSTHSRAGSLTIRPPLFSSSHRVMLWSPASMTVSRISSFGRARMESQQLFFSPAFSRTYTLSRLKFSFESWCWNFMSIQWVFCLSNICLTLASFQRIPRPPEAPLSDTSCLPLLF